MTDEGRKPGRGRGKAAVVPGGDDDEDLESDISSDFSSGSSQGSREGSKERDDKGKLYLLLLPSSVPAPAQLD
jgi:hypothetical protein